MKKEIDTGFSYSGGKFAYFSSNEEKWINVIRKLHEDSPDDVIIIKEPKENSGAIYAKLQPSMLKLQAKRTRTMTDEQREAAKERGKLLAAMRYAKKGMSSDVELTT